MSAPEEREQNWYPVSQVGWFTAHIREGIAVTGHQLELPQLGLARPGRLDDAAVARIIRVHQEQAGDLVYFQNQADKWKALPDLELGLEALLRGWQRHWLLPAPEGDGGTVPADGTGDEGAVPMSVLRYVQRTREPLVVDDAVRDDRFVRDPYFADADCCSLLAVPIVSRALLRAVLLLENRLIRGAFTAERLDAVQLIAGQLAVSLDNAQLYAELTASRARIVAAADQARRRIERDLHDGAQQRLVSLALHVRAAQAAAPPTLAAELDRAVAEATGALDELRKTARGIHPAILAEGGLRPALRTLARRSPVPVALDLRADGRLPDQIEVSAYYVVAEALTNAAKHAHASAVSVEVEADGHLLRVVVGDDGAGGADFTGGTGLAGLRDRVEALGGRIFLDSPRGTGTSLRAELPITAANDRGATPS